MRVEQREIIRCDIEVRIRDRNERRAIQGRVSVKHVGRRLEGSSRVGPSDIEWSVGEVQLG